MWDYHLLRHSAAIYAHLDRKSVMTWAESESKEAATIVEEDGEDEDEEDTCYERCRVICVA